MLTSIKDFFKQRAKNPKKTSLPNFIWQDLGHFLACGFGTGALPIAPGTFATLIAIPFYLLLAPLHWLAYLIILIFLIIAASYLSERTSKVLGVHDHSGVNCDEIVGYLVTMFMVPANITNIILGFALFRLFDIWKPWPIRALDKSMPGGFGMIVDDIVAGLFALALLQLYLLW